MTHSKTFLNKTVFILWSSPSLPSSPPAKIKQGGQVMQIKIAKKVVLAWPRRLGGFEQKIKIWFKNESI